MKNPAAKLELRATLSKQASSDNELNMKKPVDTPLLILASSSPRRRYLLEQAGLEFVVVPSLVDENKISQCAPEEYVIRLAEAKAGEVARKYAESWVIGADTVVVVDRLILGKPRTQNEARNMLLKLSGRIHQVYTGFSICCKKQKRTFSKAVKTDVLFKELSDEEIEWYINTPEPFDKAGGYAIQGKGSFLIRHIYGSYTNVVGLPVSEVLDFLIKENLLKSMNMNQGVCHAESKS